MRTGSSTCAHWKSLPVLALSVIGLTGCSPLALESGTAITVTEPPPATVGIVPTLIPTDSGGYPGPEPSVPPPTIVPTVEETPPYLIATPKPIIYSLESTTDWLLYDNPQLGISLKYPETLPRQHRSTEKDYAWDVLEVWIRTGPTLPGVWTNNAYIAITVHPNPERLPVVEAVTRLDKLYGPLAIIEPNETASRILENLRLAGAEQVQAFSSAFPKPLYGATRGDRLYVLGVGAMTDSEAQDKVFELLTTTLQFTD